MISSVTRNQCACNLRDLRCDPATQLGRKELDDSIFSSKSRHSPYYPLWIANIIASGPFATDERERHRDRVKSREIFKVVTTGTFVRIQRHNFVKRIRWLSFSSKSRNSRLLFLIICFGPRISSRDILCIGRKRKTPRPNAIREIFNIATFGTFVEILRHSWFEKNLMTLLFFQIKEQLLILIIRFGSLILSHEVP